MKQSIKLIAVVEVFIIASSLISFNFYINLQIAFLSSFFIILGSYFTYKKMINIKVNSDITEEKRDLLDDIEDPHELYDDNSINNAPVEELDLKTIVKEEKKKIKTFNLSSIKYGVRCSTSIFRIIPYVFLILGFIALKNNQLLDIVVYLPSLLVGIVVGSISAKNILS